LRCSTIVAEKTCHAVASTAQIGLTLALGPMITFQQLEDFFSDTRETYKSGRSFWSIDDTCRWSYFFVDPDLKKFGPVADHLETLGYEVVGTLDPEASDE